MNHFTLSPIDHAFLGHGAYPVQFIFYYKENIDIDALRDSFSSIRHLFWPVSCGRLERYEGLYLCRKTDQFLSVEETICKQPLPKFDSPAELASYAFDIDLNEALAKFHVFQFEKGSILSVNIAHSIVDGYSFFYLLSMWAKCTKYRKSSIKKAMTKILGRPSHNRSLLRLELQSVEVPTEERALKHWLFDNTGLSLSRKKEGFTLENSKWSTFNVTKDEIKKLVSISFENPKELGLSWHDLLSALIWQRTADKWDSSGDSLTLSSAFDFRRVSLQVNPRYFGNAIRACGVRVSKTEFEKSSLIDLAQKIRRSTGEVDNASINRCLECIDSLWRSGGEDFTSRIHVADPDNGLLVTNLSRLPTRSLDFGTGAPEVVVPMTPAPRSAVITSIPDGYSVRLSDPLESPQ